MPQACVRAPESENAQARPAGAKRGTYMEKLSPSEKIKRMYFAVGLAMTQWQQVELALTQPLYDPRSYGRWNRERGLQLRKVYPHQIRNDPRRCGRTPRGFRTR
jgi:hypothetical protein